MEHPLSIYVYREITEATHVGLGVVVTRKQLSMSIAARVVRTVVIQSLLGTAFVLSAPLGGASLQDACTLLQQVCNAGPQLRARSQQLCADLDRHCSRKARCFHGNEHTEAASYWSHQDATEQEMRAKMQHIFFRP